MYYETERLFFLSYQQAHAHKSKSQSKMSEGTLSYLSVLSIETEVVKFMSFEKIKVYAAPPQKKNAGKESVIDVVQAAN